MQYCMLKLAFGCSIILVITWLLQPLAPSHFLHFLRRKNNMQAPTLYTKCQFDNPHMNLSWTLDKNTYNNKPECTLQAISVRPKIGFGIGNRNQGPISGIGIWAEYFFPKLKPIIQIFSCFFCFFRGYRFLIAWI